MNKTLNQLNQEIANKTQELKNLSTASGHYGTVQEERSQLIRERDALIHSTAVDKQTAER